MQTQNTSSQEISQYLSRAPKEQAMRHTVKTYLAIKNWDKYQHYKDKSPPWIKLYRSLLNDYSFSCLIDSEKWLFVGLLLLASESENALKEDIFWIKRRLSITSKKINESSIERLISLQLIERKSVALKNTRLSLDKVQKKSSKRLAPVQKKSTSETETETETETDAALQQQHARARAKPSAAAVASIKNEFHKSAYEFDIIVEYVETKKKNVNNPPGLARTLYRSGDEDVKIAAWLNEKEAAATAEAEAKQREQAQAREYAQDMARELIQHGGLRDWQDALSLQMAIEHYYSERNESEFNLRTYRQLKKMIPYAVSLLSEHEERREHYAETIERLQALESDALAAS